MLNSSDSEMPEKLSDIDLKVHGFTADDIINERKAKNKAIKEAALRGNRIALMSVELDNIAKSYGIDMDYHEDITDDDSESF